MRRRRFPYNVSRWQQIGRNGKTYHCTGHYYIAVHGNPKRPGTQEVWFYLLIEGVNGYRREVRGDSKIAPIVESARSEAHKKHNPLVPLKCHLCREEKRRQSVN